MPTSTPAKRPRSKKNTKTATLSPKLRLSRAKTFALVAVFAVIGGATILFSSAATPIPTGAYEGSINPRGADSFAKDYLGKSSSDVALDFIPGDSWEAIEGPSWMFDPWVKGGYKQKMVFGVPMLPPDTSTTMAQGAAGKYNAHYKALAENLVDAGMNNASLRLGWEFNGNWYRWSAANGQAGNFISYWQQIVTTMRAVPGANFKFNWNPTNGTASLAHPEDAYPGDAYVDQIGDDVYNGSWAPNYTDPTARWNDIYFGTRGLQFWVNFAKAHNKPISFPEWGTGDRADGHGGGDDPIFIQNMYNVMQSTNTAFNIYWDFCPEDYCSALDEYPKTATAVRSLFAGSGSTIPTPVPPTPVPAPAPTVTLTANPSGIAKGSTSKLTWSSTNATSCTASGGWSGNQAVSNLTGITVTPASTTTYMLSCNGSGGSGSANTRITVSVPSTPTTPAPTVTLTASPASIVKGTSSKLTWSSTNATSCTASGGWSGNQATGNTTGITVAPNAATSYTLRCTGAGGQASATANIAVTAPPAPPATPMPTTVALTIAPAPKGSNNQVSDTIQLSIPKSAQTNLSKVQYYVDGSLKQTSTRSSSTYKVDTTRLSNGVHTFSVKTTSKTGSTSVGTKQVTVYNKPSFIRRSWNSVRSWF